MKNFLKKYGLSDEEIAKLTSNYVEAHKNDSTPPTELPTHIGKSRLDEVLEQKKTAETNTAAANKRADDAEKALKALQEAQPNDTKAAVEAALAEADKKHKAEIKALQNDYSLTEAIHAAKGKNVKAIKALIDPSKKIEDELKRLQESDAYLFGDGADDDIPGGTGKKGPNAGGNNEAELESMRRAVGL